jgi:uncharacterized protein (DUF2141 family)
MIATIPLAFLFLSTLLFHEKPNNTSENFKLEVEIDNIKHTKGQVMRIAIDKKQDFLGDNTPLRYSVIATKNNKISEVFSLPTGDYAVSIYQDLNGNGVMDKNFFGAPTEPYGFSRNYKPTFRAPKFDEVKIALNNDRKTTISLIQP